MRDQCCSIASIQPLTRCEREAEWQVESEAFPAPKKLCGQHVAGYLHSRYPNTVTYLRVVDSE